jgi:futalosine hydrolase
MPSPTIESSAYSLIVVPTLGEVGKFFKDSACRQIKSNLYFYENHHLLIAGAGIMPFTYQLTNYLLCNPRPTKVILAGVAGSFSEHMLPGTLVEVTSEILAECGAEDNDGKILSMESIGIWDGNVNSGFLNAKVINPSPEYPDLPKVKSITVHTASGSLETIRRRIIDYQSDIENMEGIAFFNICEQFKLPYAQVRAISNYIEPRNRGNWKLELAIENLGRFLSEQI